MRKLDSRGRRGPRLREALRHQSNLFRLNAVAHSAESGKYLVPFVLAPPPQQPHPSWASALRPLYCFQLGLGLGVVQYGLVSSLEFEASVLEKIGESEGAQAARQEAEKLAAPPNQCHPICAQPPRKLEKRKQ